MVDPVQSSMFKVQRWVERDLNGLNLFKLFNIVPNVRIGSNVHGNGSEETR